MLRLSKLHHLDPTGLEDIKPLGMVVLAVVERPDSRADQQLSAWATRTVGAVHGRAPHAGTQSSCPCDGVGLCVDGALADLDVLVLIVEFSSSAMNRLVCVEVATYVGAVW